MNNKRLEASSRMALAAYLHDLGKFAERANIGIPKEKYAIHEQMYCKRNEKNGATWYSHKHAAYTALGFELIEEYMPALKGTDFAPFGSMHSHSNADDSLVNASAMHHRPEGFLQWIVATADRAASGFEREEFDQYNESEEGTETGKNHYQARMLSLLEQIHLGDGKTNITPDSLKYRHPLVPMSPSGIFPQLREKCEPADDSKAKKQYLELWNGFMNAIKEIPESHQQQLPLWLDHFDTLWLTFTQAIPSATAFKTRPDVSLYDHSKTTAALATALWRYHSDLAHDHAIATTSMKTRDDWDEEKFLLIQGDFYGVQDFIFAQGSETNKRAAKLLRGRSFYVSLLTECAALKILEALDLPSTSQITNAAGKFLIVAPNTDEAKQKITEIQQEFDQWFLKQTYGRGGIGIAIQEASCNDFVSKKEGSGFAALMKKLFEKLEAAKYRQFGLCHNTAAHAVFSDYLDSFDNTLGICQIDPYAPATKQDGELKLSKLAADHILLGEHLTQCKRLLISAEPLSESRYSLKVPVFGYSIHLTGNEEETGKFGPSARNGILRRAFDFSLPEKADAVLWNGYARRNINGYIPEFTAQDKQYLEKYKGTDPVHIGDIKTLTHIGCENRKPKDGDMMQWVGISAIGTLKGDVDNLGSIFQKGLEKPTFAKMAALSRQMNNFFAVYLPSLCRKEFPNTYTVFAGGDDFFLIGSWRSQIALANRLRKEFSAYCANNPDLHFSSGISITKPGLPIGYLAKNGEEALEMAKKSEDNQHGSKNALSVFGQTLPWEKTDALLQACDALENLADEYKLSTAYIYSLLQMISMVEDTSKPENSLWRSQLTYRTWRMLQQKSKSKEREKLLEDHQKLVKTLGEQGLQQWQGTYRIAIQTYLYQNR